jgi:DNA repair protein SbcC/Rad50
MLIHEVTLRNIRSYENISIDFAEGITLLSGDIGAGKSSILHAIEFSLFGIQRGGLEGESLLRHGSDEGGVSVLYTIQEQEVRVTRGLKRTGQGVRQTDGILSINGVNETLTASELKARILALLGYPEQLVTKSKGLIFRHTVYTPQEEMKQIIFMPAEERLNTLRILFGIEKYRIIKENTQLFLRELRRRELDLLQSASQVPGLERELKDMQAQSAVSEQAVQQAEGAAREATASLHLLRKETQQARLAWEQSLALEQRRTSLQHRIKEMERSARNSVEDIERIDQYLAVPLEPVLDNTAQIDALRTQLDATDEQLLSATRVLAEQRGKQKHLLEQEQRITHMDACPVCQQTVTASHKQHIHSQSANTLSGIEHTINELSHKEQQLRKQRLELQGQMQKLHEHQKRFAGYQKELFVRREQEFSKERLLTRQAAIQKELTEARDQLEAIPAADPAIALAYNQAQEKLTVAEEKMHAKLTALSIARDEHSRRGAQLTLVKDRLSQAQESQKQAARLQSLRQWLEEHFLELVTNIERHVLASIHAEFRELFQKWFGKLIEDETISVSLGEQFEPLVTQNGYDASLEQLSGGEKTAVALSYRLSLYKVVSDFIATIHTKDLLILDEPTDGFSTEQLDKVRDVLRELDCRQILLVSHETQMESSSDHVIRVTKRMHRSST